MTGEQRTAIRLAIDRARRNQIKRLRFAYPRGYCKGCGINRAEYAPGCGTCRERRRMRTKRTLEVAGKGRRRPLLPHAGGDHYPNPHPPWTRFQQPAVQTHHALRPVTTLELTERDLTKQVRELAALFGWRRYHTWLSQHSTAGFPDECLVRPPRVVFAELKRETGKLTPAQAEWLDDLADCGLEVYLWRPSMIDDIASCLACERPRTRPGAWHTSAATHRPQTPSRRTHAKPSSSRLKNPAKRGNLKPMGRIGWQSGVDAARARMKRLDPGGFNTQGTGAWDKFFNTVTTLVTDHDAAYTTPPKPPDRPKPVEPVYVRVAPRVAYKAGGSDARYCTVNQPGVRPDPTGSPGHKTDESGATYDENGLCKNGRRSDGPAVTSALEIDGRAYCDLPRIGDPTKNTGSWAI